MMASATATIWSSSTYLIFLKMADEYAKPPFKRDVGIPAKYTSSRLN